MARYNMEVELDWIDNCEEGTSVEDEIREQVIKSIKNELLKKATEETVKKLDTAVAEKFLEVANLIGDKVDNFIEKVCEEKISSMQIPYKENSWSDEVKFISMSEFVGQRYEAFLNRKVFDRNGDVPRYDSDKNTSLNEYFVKNILRKN